MQRGHILKIAIRTVLICAIGAIAMGVGGCDTADDSAGPVDRDIRVRDVAVTPSLLQVGDIALIEVLVATVVISVGLVGLAGLQTLSMKNNHSAYLRTQATMLTYDMVDRMRANVAAAQAGQYTTAFNTAPAGTVNCESSTCSSASLATFDVNQWKVSLGIWDAINTCSVTLSKSGLLPGGDGQVTQVGTVHTISIRWNDRDGTQNTFQVSTEI